MGDSGLQAVVEAGDKSFFRFRYKTNRFHPGLLSGPLVAIALTGNRLYAVPWYSPIDVTVTDLAIEIDTPQGGKSARLGIYIAGSDSLPGELLLDAGTVTIDGNGVRAVTGLTQVLVGGTLYWLAFVSNATGAGTGVFIEAMQNPGSGQVSLPLGYGAADWKFFGIYQSVYRAFTYGALPTPFSTPTLAVGGPVIAAKIS